MNVCNGMELRRLDRLKQSKAGRIMDRYRVHRRGRSEYGESERREIADAIDDAIWRAESFTSMNSHSYGSIPDRTDAPELPGECVRATLPTDIDNEYARNHLHFGLVPQKARRVARD